MNRFLAFDRARCCGLLLAVFTLAACAAPAAPPPTTAPARTPAPGSDRDAHGCIPSAGYQWCQRTNRCERSWELAKKEGFANTADGFKVFCMAPKN